MPSKRHRKGIHRSDELVDRIAPILSGESPDVTGATLGELTAIWLAGHQADDPDELRKFREEIFDAHVKLVWSMVALHDKRIRRVLDAAAAGSKH